MPFCRQAGLFVYPTLACPGSAQDRCKSHGRAPSGDSLHVSEHLHVCHFTSLLQDEVCNTMKTRNAVFGHVSLEQGRGLMGGGGRCQSSETSSSAPRFSSLEDLRKCLKSLGVE